MSGYVLAGMSTIWTGLIMTNYFGYVIAEFLPYAKHTSPIAIGLWGWGVATFSIGYTQQREVDLGGKSNIPLVAFSQIGFLVSTILLAGKFVTPTSAGFASIAIISSGLLIQLFIEMYEFHKFPKVVDV
jgi:hypothetical protein